MGICLNSYFGRENWYEWIELRLIKKADRDTPSLYYTTHTPLILLQHPSLLKQLACLEV
jgi:hypothetical protein